MTIETVTNIPANVERALATLYKLGTAYRGDWSEYDGRALRAQLDEAANIIRGAAAGEDMTRAIAGFYTSYSICPTCGSWTEHCAGH